MKIFRCEETVVDSFVVELEEVACDAVEVQLELLEHRVRLIAHGKLCDSDQRTLAVATSAWPLISTMIAPGRLRGATGADDG